MPPALPYWRPAGAFAAVDGREVTKRLVFSSWQVVPKMIAGLVSYEAERRLIRLHERHPRNTLEARRRRSPLLRFTIDRTGPDERLTGMPVLGVMYPSAVLAGLVQPPMPAEDGRPVDAASLISRLEDDLEPLLRKIGAEPGAAPFDEQWYWAAPILLDLSERPIEATEWLERHDLPQRWAAATSDDTDGGHRSLSVWAEHVQRAREMARRRDGLGAAPPDLAQVLAQAALGSPGVVALRSLARQAGGSSARWEPWVRDAAACAAWGFRSLFNVPESMALLRGLDPAEPYWRRVIDYCIDGNLQSVLDEYCHMLRDGLGLFDRSPRETVEAIAAVLERVVGMRASTLSVDLVDLERGRPSLSPLSLRGRFARRFDRATTDGTGEVTTAEHVRDAFNSPFWPFVLATTSVGQEGLDFHPYCHAVVHWNLPPNPVDMEQREGRVHRFKNHAVRKNLARRYGVGPVVGATDPWECLFDLGRRDRPRGSSDLVPFWVYPARDDAGPAAQSGLAKIERHVPILPLSREEDRIGDLRRSLAVYRMVFGQPRQEDLLAYLLERLGPDRAAECLDQLRIDLSPPAPDHPPPFPSAAPAAVRQ
jgi:hypothetical protein